MGLFDLLFSSRPDSSVEAANDRIWMSLPAKFRGVRRELEERASSDSVALLLIAHFHDTLEQLQAMAAEYNGKKPAMATLAEELSLDLARNLHLAQTDTIDLIVAERHPLLSVDARLMRFAEELPCRCRVAQHLSLEDPLLKAFAGEQALRILERLGMTEDEAIESRMVSRRIKATQKKIEAQACAGTEADSAAEWMAKSLPEEWKQ